jgi:hypothetical protein
MSVLGWRFSREQLNTYRCFCPSASSGAPSPREANVGPGSGRGSRTCSPVAPKLDLPGLLESSTSLAYPWGADGRAYTELWEEDTLAGRSREGSRNRSMCCRMDHTCL